MDTAPAAPTEAPPMTNLEAQRRCLADYRQYAADADNEPSRSFWNAMAETCAITIAGILRTNDDDYIPF
jgi:hypothetical protein